MWSLDARIPVTVLADAAALEAALAAPGPGRAAVLLELPGAGTVPLPAGTPRAGFAPADAWHRAAGCACCAGRRSPVAAALDGLFQQRARGQCAWFDRVLALAPTAAGADMLAATLREDAVVAARFRPAGS